MGDVGVVEWGVVDGAPRLLTVAIGRADSANIVWAWVLVFGSVRVLAAVLVVFSDERLVAEKLRESWGDRHPLVLSGQCDVVGEVL